MQDSTTTNAFEGQENLDAEAWDLVGFDRLDRPFRFTRFKSQAARTKSDGRASLREMAAMIEAAKADRREKLPWFKFAVFGDTRTEKDCLRHDANVLAVTGAEADYDAGTITFEEACDRLAKARVTAFLYSSPSHLQPGKGSRWRVFAPFSKELPPVERERHVARLNGLFGGALDPASFTMSQSYYGGSVTGRPKVQTFLVEGRYLDKAADLDAGAVGRPGRAKSDGATGTGEKTGRPLKTILDALKHIPNDGSIPEHDSRDFWLGVGMALHHESDGAAEGSEAFQEWSAQWPGYDADGTAAAWESFGRKTGRVLTGHHILALAGQHGWRDLERIFGLFDDLPPDEDEDADDDADGPGAGKRTGPLTFLTPGECAATDARPYVIKGIVAAGDVGCIVGAPGVGKSLLGPRLGYAVAQGESIFGMRTRQGGVFYVAAEDHHGMRARITALKNQHGDADRFTLVGGVSDLLSKGSEHPKALRAAIKERRPSLVFIDTLAMAFPGLEENDAASMNRVVTFARSLTKWGAAVILIHHDTKEGGGLPRGHSVLNGALDVSIHLTSDGGIVRGALTKNRNGSRERDIAFTIGTRTLGIDEDGDAITAAMCCELEPGSAPERGERLNDGAKAALRILAELIESEGVEIGGRRGVPQEAWRRVCIDGLELSASDNRDARKKAFNRALKVLAEKRRVELRDGHYFLPVVAGDEFFSANDDGGDDGLL